VKQGLIASNLDPCLFVSKTLIMIIYLDDILIYGRSTDKIDNLIKCLKKDDIALNKEGMAEGYLGVDIQQDGDIISLLQEGLTKWIITALGLDSKYSTPMNTPAEMAALGHDIDGKEASGCIIMQALLACFCISDIADPTYPLQLTSVHTTPTPLNNFTKML
jgi:hypothetical protein